MRTCQNIYNEGESGIVDKALAAIGGVIKPDILNKLYRPLGSMVYYSYYTHKPLEPYPPVAEKGGSGGEFREAFKDTAYFATAKTDTEGVAVFTFNMPDNLTAWLMYAQVVDGNLLAGQSDERVVTSQDFFVTSNFPKKYLVEDRPILAANSFGSGINSGDKVAYTATIFSGESERNKKDATGSVFKDVGIAIPELPSGEYRLGLLGKSNSYEDAVRYPFEVIETAWEFEHSRQYAIEAGKRLDDLKLGNILKSRPVTLVLTDGGKGKYYRELKQYCYLSSNRLEKRVAKMRAGQLVSQEFGDENCQVDMTDKQKFQDVDGGLTQVVWGGSNLETSVWAVHTNQDGWNADKLKEYFLNNAMTGGGNIQKIYGWWGVVEMNGPGLRQLKLLSSKSSSFEEKVLSGLALAFAGEKETAREMYSDIMTDYAYTNKPYVRIQRDGESATDINRTVKDTAWTLLLGNQIGAEYNSGMDIYLRQNSYEAEDVVPDLARIAFVEEELARSPKGDTAIKVNTPIKEVSSTLSRGRSETLTLSEAEVSNTKISVTTGKAEITANYYLGPQGAKQIDKDKRIGLKRTIKKVTGGGELKAGDIVEIKLEHHFSSEAPRGSYVLRDYLPAGLVYLENPQAYGFKSVGWIGNLNNVITSRIYNSPWWPTANATVYFARAAVGGTYIAEPAIMQAGIDLEVFTLTNEEKIKIGVGD